MRTIKPPKGLSISVTCRRRISKWHTISEENVEISSNMIPATMSLKLRAANSTPNPWLRRNLTSSSALNRDGCCWCTSGRQKKSPENVSPPIAVAVIALKEVQINSLPLDLAASRRAKIRRVFQFRQDLERASALLLHVRFVVTSSVQLHQRQRPDPVPTCMFCSL
jgi:hypothetical protein